MSVRCEACAVRYGYERAGEAYMAVKTLGFAVSLLRETHVEDETIVEMVQTILTDPHSIGSYDIGGDHLLPGPDRVQDRPWMTGHVELPRDEAQ